MMASEGPYGQAKMVDWAHGARVRSAACAEQAKAAAESAAAIRAQVDRIIGRVAERHPERAKHLQALMVSAASQRPAIADGTRSHREVPVPDLAVVHDQTRADGELPDQVIERVFAAALTLQDAARLTTEPEVCWRITAAVGDLDELVHLIRDALFGSAGWAPKRVAGSGPDGQLPIT